nr:MAG TPA: hypothetical protein [Caudoviricetes sp.]
MRLQYCSLIFYFIRKDICISAILLHELIKSAFC